MSKLIHRLRRIHGDRGMISIEYAVAIGVGVVLATALLKIVGGAQVAAALSKMVLSHFNG